MRNIICMIMAAVFALPVLVVADSYVATAPLGNDANDGLTVATPKATITAAAAVAAEGETIHVAAGTYSGAGNVQLDWNAYKNRSIVGAGPDATIIQVTGGERFLNRLEMQTMNPLLANFQIAYDNMDPWDLGGVSFGDGGNNLSVVISNVWFNGPYDGDQVVGTDGTDAKRNGAAIFLMAYPEDKFYSGQLLITHCLFSGWGRALAFNDYQSDLGSCSVSFEYCTFANNADTGAGWVDGSTIWFRGNGSNRVYSFTKCVMSHNGTDTGCEPGTWGVRAITCGVDYTPITLDGNLFDVSTLNEGRVYFENAGFYVNIAGDVTNATPNYITYNGKPYTITIASEGEARGWSWVIPEPGMGIAGIALFLAGLVRKINS